MKLKTKIIVSLLLVVLLVLAAIFGVKILLKYFSPNISRTEWAFEVTQITELNALGFYGSNVTVGIVDTGINIAHQELNHIKLIAWKDFVFNCTEPYDDNGHGTHVAGIIAANYKLKGIAPYVSLIIAKALTGDGSGDDNIVAMAINFCVDPNMDGNSSDGADVICLSLGGRKIPALGTASEAACKDAAEKGIFVVAAAGNEYPNRDVATPGTVDLVISVGAIDKDKKIAEFSSKGSNPTAGMFKRSDPNKKPELVAPGVEILSSWKYGYAYCSGTSQSAPFVAGIIALLLDAYPKYQHEFNNNSNAIIHFKYIFMATAEILDYQNTPHDDRYGYGLIKVYEAYIELSRYEK